MGEPGRSKCEKTIVGLRSQSQTERASTYCGLFLVIRIMFLATQSPKAIHQQTEPSLLNRVNTDNSRRLGQLPQSSSLTFSDLKRTMLMSYQQHGAWRMCCQVKRRNTSNKHWSRRTGPQHKQQTLEQENRAATQATNTGTGEQGRNTSKWKKDHLFLGKNTVYKHLFLIIKYENFKSFAGGTTRSHTMQR